MLLLILVLRPGLGVKTGEIRHEIVKILEQLMFNGPRKPILVISLGKHSHSAQRRLTWPIYVRAVGREGLRSGLRSWSVARLRENRTIVSQNLGVSCHLNKARNNSLPTGS